MVAQDSGGAGVRRRFKNALCLALRPATRFTGETGSSRYAHKCKRHLGHEGDHRVHYSDAVIEWDAHRTRPLYDVEVERRTFKVKP